MWHMHTIISCSMYVITRNETLKYTTSEALIYTSNINIISSENASYLIDAVCVLAYSGCRYYTICSTECQDRLLHNASWHFPQTQLINY